MKFFRVDLGGYRLAATEADWSCGQETLMCLTAKDIHLVITARKPLLAPANS